MNDEVPLLKQITPRLRQTGEFYELDGEPIRRVVGRVRIERDPFDVLWDLRESAMELLGGELPTTLTLMSRFGELLEMLARADVRYVLVGGGAVLLHGHSRTTADLDILIEASEENARRLLAALARWGEGVGAELEVEELALPQLGALRVIEGFTLDVFTLMRARGRDTNLDFHDLIDDADKRTLSNGVEVRFASIRQLLDLKANTGRPKDVSDTAILAEIARGHRLPQSVDLAAIEADAGAASSDQGEWPH